MQAEVTELLERGDASPARGPTPGGPLEVRAQLVCGADGRHPLFADGAVEVIDIGLLWICGYGFPVNQGDPDQTFGRFADGEIVAFINRRDYGNAGMDRQGGTRKSEGRAWSIPPALGSRLS